MESACKFSPSGILHVYIFSERPDDACYPVFVSGAECAVMQYVNVCELQARAQEETCYIMKQLELLIFVISAMNMVESFLAKA